MRLNKIIPTTILSLTSLFAQAAPDCCRLPEQGEVVTKAETVASPYTITLKTGEQVSLNGLVDDKGSPVDDAYAAKHFAGKRLAIYFGFPTCTWFCPSSIQAIKSAGDTFAEKYPAQARNVQYLFIASRTHPKTGADYTPPEMAEWIKPINGAIGLTGPKNDLSRVWQIMKVNNAQGVHLPIVIFTDETGKVTGSAIAVKPSPDGRKAPPPNSESVLMGMERCLVGWCDTPPAPTPAP